MSDLVHKIMITSNGSGLDCVSEQFTKLRLCYRSRSGEDRIATNSDSEWFLDVTCPECLRIMVKTGEKAKVKLSEIKR